MTDFGSVLDGLVGEEKVLVGIHSFKEFFLELGEIGGCVGGEFEIAPESV